MFTYSTNLRGTVTAALNSLANSAIMDEEEEKVKLVFLYSHDVCYVNFLQRRPRRKLLKKILNCLSHGSFLWRLHPKVRRSASRSFRQSFPFRFSKTLSQLAQNLFLQEDASGKICAVQHEGRHCPESIRVRRLRLWVTAKQSETETSPFHLVKELIFVTQRYEHRHDRLETREHDVRTNTVYENYLPGRTDQLKGMEGVRPN